MIDYIEDEMREHNDVIEHTMVTLVPALALAGNIIIKSLSSGGKLLIFGNGGSAADAQHMAAEFTGRYLKNRKALPAIALTTDSSALTAIANDFGYDEVFSRQVEALANPGDVILGITTSGKSSNVLKAFETAHKLDCQIIALTGRDAGPSCNYADALINIPHDHTPRIQEMHLLMIHILCGIAEQSLT